LGIVGNNNESSNCIILEEYLGGTISAVKSVTYLDSSYNLPNGFSDQQITIINNTNPSARIDVSGSFFDTEKDESYSILIVPTKFKNAELIWNDTEKKWFAMYRSPGVTFGT
jgi:hypothetical protein